MGCSVARGGCIPRLRGERILESSLVCGVPLKWLSCVLCACVCVYSYVPVLCRALVVWFIEERRQRFDGDCRHKKIVLSGVLSKLDTTNVWYA